MAGSDEGKSSTPTLKHFFISQTPRQHSRFCRDQSGIQVASRRVSWRFDAVPSNGSNRILSNGARLRLMMPNGRMEIPVSSRCGLDGGFLMDAYAAGYHFLAKTTKAQLQN